MVLLFSNFSPASKRINNFVHHKREDACGNSSRVRSIQRNTVYIHTHTCTHTHTHIHPLERLGDDADYHNRSDKNGKNDGQCGHKDSQKNGGHT